MTAPLQAPAGAALTSRRIGPMRVRNGRYFDGEQSYQRTSKLLENIETDTYHLDQWRENMLAIGLSMRSDLVLGVAAAAQYDPQTGKLTPEAKSTLRGLRHEASEAAKSTAGRNQGTAVHTATERLDLGETVEQIRLPAPFDEDLRAYETLKRAMGLTFRPEHIERTVRNSTTASAGTFDRLGECELLIERGVLSPGELIVVDVKTEDDPLLNMIHICPQLADYAYADDMFVPEPGPPDDPVGIYRGRYEPMPNVNRLVGLIVHVRNGRAVPYLVDLTAGWRSVQRAAKQRDELKASKVKLGEPGAWVVAVPVDLPQPEYAVGDSVTVTGVRFTKHDELPGHEQLVASVAARGPMGASAPAGMTAAQYVATADIPRSGLTGCLNCAPLQAGVSATRVDGTSTGACTDCGSVVTEEAQRGPDGLVRWSPVPDEHRLHAALVEQVRLASDMPRLAELFELAQQHGVRWEGLVAEVADRRRRIIECVQRPLHGGAGQCACGWSEKSGDLP